MKQRIINSGSDSDKGIAMIINQARKDSLMMEDYDYAVVNNTVANAVDQIKTIFEAEHVRVPRVINDYRNMVKED